MLAFKDHVVNFVFFYQMNMSLTLDSTKKQWVDLGVHLEACLTNVDCSAAGGAISLWLSGVHCGGSSAGFISSRKSSSKIGTVGFCNSNNIL